MKTVTIPETFEKYIADRKEYMNGEQVRLAFPNNYGASVINHDGSYGLELAVLYEGHICYNTEITSDVIGSLDQEELEKVLNDIFALEDK